ncbi:uncharacterized protein LOC119673878 isoform X1 [Teleopsis dalmanni]|uniref:uncharacterized protein LOC119673878 isoform X1 n=1 Tax=Teleopsis dalmanni TaxID=139649 RepID=UPI0018CCBF29|nr:uncharacterized protein LOC119673878 isoform X1 [Teleopsis dalmanni]
MSSSICPHFTQNAWKKDLCSNCFKSKDEHKQASASSSRFSAFSTSSIFTSNQSQKIDASDNKKTDYPNKHRTPVKSIIKKALAKTNKSKSHKVCFRKTLFEVIGYGGEWSDDSDDADDDDFMNIGNEHDDNAITNTDDEETAELKRITKANTDFNMNNGNLLGDPQENIKKSFAALKLGAPQVDKEGNKQTLKINVVPFGATTNATAVTSTISNATDTTKQMTAATTVKGRFESKSGLGNSDTKQNVNSEKTIKKTPPSLTFTSVNSNTSSTSVSSNSKSANSNGGSILTKIQNKQQESSSDSDGKNSPPIERAMEKSLLDEISETLEQKQNESNKLTGQDKVMAVGSKIKFEISSLSESVDSKPFLDLKKPIVRNPPITKEHTKPKINVFHKYSDTDSNCSDAENGVSAYYDVVETQISYENLADGKFSNDKKSINAINESDKNATKSHFSNSQYITDMLLSSKTRAASYNLHEGNFMTSKITSDGLIVTKCSSDDALDSTGSSFDGSSDEETSYNMIRSESDSGIGISIGNEFKNGGTEKERERQRLENKLSISTNNSDYEDIQVANQTSVVSKVAVAPRAKKSIFPPEKSRELHGEPDGSADPDGSLENKEQANHILPALPKSPPPTKIIEARPSFLHGLQKQHPPIVLKKPDLPAKPIVSPVNSPLKTFVTKRQPTCAEQQVISQLQLVMSKSNENLNADIIKDDAKLKKGRAPNPPPEYKTSAPPTPERDYSLVLEFENEMKEDEKKKLISISVEEQPQSTVQTQSDLNANTEKTKHVKTETDAVKLKELITPNVTEIIPNCSANIAETNSANSSSISSSLYTRKLPAIASNVGNITKNSSSPVIREKDKRERATVNPKFRSLNTFVTQRSNAVKNLQYQTGSGHMLSSFKQPLTPELIPRNHKNLSLSEQCLTESGSQSTVISVSTMNLTTTAANLSTSSNTTASSNDKKAASPTQKAKTKFSIKKFLRMGTSKTTDNLHKKEGIYSEICTGEDASVAGKPRLVIIHPIDINPTAVEVVKDITKTNDAVATQTVAVLTAKPPAPPLRATDGQRSHEINKPARPPPPKSAELRRKQKIGLCATSSLGEAGGSIKCKSDNVYANLGEIRSSIAPRKPERTASMREREAQLELARKRHVGARNENIDTISICSSNGDNVSLDQVSTHHNSALHSKNSTGGIPGSQLPTTNRTTAILTNNSFNSVVDGKPPSGSRTSTFERKKGNDSKMPIANKLEIFENPTNNNINKNELANSIGNANSNATDNRPTSLKDSVRKINNTIDSYLKDKRDYENMYEFVKASASPPPPPARSVDLTNGGQRILPTRRSNNLYSDTASVTSYTRSEYGASRTYGLNNSLANIPRIISASYCGSEVGEFDIYAPYSYYGSEAGGDVATDINDSVWGIPSAVKNRVKATNRLRMRKGRSVVHKTIEDNYTAVVVANHEALAQVLDQLQQTPIIPPALRPLANAINLRFEDFTILEGTQAFVVGKKAFHAALWTTAPVTLALSADCNQLSGVGGELNQLSGGISGVLNPITEFCDLVPSYHLPLMPTTEVTLLQATISVLPRLQLDTLLSIGAILKGKSQVLDKSNYNFRGSIPNLTGLKDGSSASALRNVVSVQNLCTLNEESSVEKNIKSDEDSHLVPSMPAFDDVMTREVAFIMLQLVNGMKNLQVKAIEDMPLSLSNVVLSKDIDNKDAQARLCVLQGSNNDEDEQMGTLCKCAHIALTDLLPATKITQILADILSQERAESLSKSKSVLEFVLWGPSDVILSGSAKERELALQHWLDLERATVLHGLVRTRIELTVYDECHLMFLVRSTAKMMNDAAKIICNYQNVTQATSVKSEQI